MLGRSLLLVRLVLFLLTFVAQQPPTQDQNQTMIADRTNLQTSDSIDH